MAEMQARKPVEDWTTDFDHFDPTYLADPDAGLQALLSNLYRLRDEPKA
mgnify:CR=1 FL=1